MASTGTSPVIATKFAPLPWRLTGASVSVACRQSLSRLGLQRMGLYIQHWPGFAFNTFSNEAYLQGLADCVDAGLTDAVGVSNFNAKRVTDAAAVLSKRGTCLSSNQVRRVRASISSTTSCPPTCPLCAFMLLECSSSRSTLLLSCMMIAAAVTTPAAPCWLLLRTTTLNNAPPPHSTMHYITRLNNALSQDFAMPHHTQRYTITLCD